MTDIAAIGSDPSRAAAAQLLGMAEREISEVKPSPRGPIIRCQDGTVMIVCPPDRPDGEGKVGTMFLRAPAGYKGTFPVFADVPRDSSLLARMADRFSPAPLVDATDLLPPADAVETAVEGLDGDGEAFDPDRVVAELAENDARRRLESLLAPVEDVTTRLELEHRTRELDEAIERAEADASAAESIAEADRLAVLLDALRRQRLVLGNRRDTVAKTEFAHQEAVAAGRDEREAAATARAYLELDPILQQIAALHAQALAVRAEAIAAGASPAIARWSNSEVPDIRAWVSTLQLLDVLSHDISTTWTSGLMPWARNVLDVGQA